MFDYSDFDWVGSTKACIDYRYTKKAFTNGIPITIKEPQYNNNRYK